MATDLIGNIYKIVCVYLSMKTTHNQHLKGGQTENGKKNQTYN